MASTRIAPAVSLGLLFACHGQPETGAPICRSGSGLDSSNGQNLNGTNLNGVWSNGIWDNGVWGNGIWENGSEWQGKSLNGVQLQGENLNGSNLNGVFQNGVVVRGVTNAGEPIELTIILVEPAGALTYYALATNDGANICGENGKGLFVPGVWDSRGQRHETLGEGESFRNATFSCTTGVIAKCVTWGYDPETAGIELHQTCTRMARADYCGDGVPHTKNGTLIDVYDVEGIQVPALNELEFEAGWGPDGAVCVHKTRYTDIGPDRRVIRPSCWSEKPACEDFDGAIDQGALIGNASGRSTRYLCEE